MNNLQTLMTSTPSFFVLTQSCILVLTMAAILVTSGLALLRSTFGPSVFDRILAVNMFGTTTVLLIAVIGFLSQRADFLDLALTYTLMNFIGVIAVLKFTKYGNLARTDSSNEVNS